MNQFQPESKRHADRWPRTLQEAFGPYAELHVDQDDAHTAVVLAVFVGIVFTVTYGLFVYFGA